MNLPKSLWTLASKEKEKSMESRPSEQLIEETLAAKAESVADLDNRETVLAAIEFELRLGDPGLVFGSEV